MNCSFVRGVMKNIGFKFLPDDLSNVDSKGLNYQDCEVSVRNHFTKSYTLNFSRPATREYVQTLWNASSGQSSFFVDHGKGFEKMHMDSSEEQQRGASI